jgi:hypothetical protein
MREIRAVLKAWFGPRFFYYFTPVFDRTSGTFGTSGTGKSVPELFPGGFACMNRFGLSPSLALLVCAFLLSGCDRIRSISPLNVEIRDFKLDKNEEVSRYTSIGRSVTYKGRGTVLTSPSTETPILILLMAKNSWKNREEPAWVIVKNGTGVLETYDYSSDAREIATPLTYEWKMLGYVELEKANLKIAN